jgi:hypothetical protein
VDRQVIGLLKPTLQQQFGWSEIDYADIVFSFQLAYAIGFVFAGRVIDRVGTRVGFGAGARDLERGGDRARLCDGDRPRRGRRPWRRRSHLQRLGRGLHGGAVRAGHR